MHDAGMPASTAKPKSRSTLASIGTKNALENTIVRVIGQSTHRLDGCHKLTEAREKDGNPGEFLTITGELA